ncbi:hypothetical protein [Actinomadura roseirufa]|uniref:hypothetical protein n=1 Tax=Actinomadura roseirufa TaxID=2094049 RepID=UPI001041A79C|nr:hypothetical protein [Actinomadura roseirufa]
MNDSYGSASQAHSQALARWEGGAAAAFGAYAADVKTVITNNVTMFQGTLDAVSKMYEAVIEAYKQAITFVSKCAQSLLDFGGGLLGDWKALLAVVGAAPTDGASLALILKHFTDLLSSFVDNVTNLINGVIETGKNFTVALSSSLRNVGAVRPVPGPTKGVLDLGAWTPA